MDAVVFIMIKNDVSILTEEVVDKYRLPDKK